MNDKTPVYNDRKVEMQQFEKTENFKAIYFEVDENCGYRTLHFSPIYRKPWCAQNSNLL